jgi:hypothetical protein
MRMLRRRAQFAVALALLLILPALPPMARADYNLQLNGNTVSVTWTIDTFQNMSIYLMTPVYPRNIDSSLTGSNLSAFAMALQNVIQEKVSSASMSNLSVHVSSNSPNLTCTASCPPQWMNATASFQVHENPQSSNGFLQYDLSWKDLRLDQDFQIDNESFNRIGEDYLVKALVPFVNFKNSGTISIVVSVNNNGVVTETYQAAVDPIVLFTAAGFQTPLEDWARSENVASQTENWTSPQNTGFNISALETVSEAGESARLNYVSGAIVHSTITTPLNSAARGDIIFVDVSGGFYEQTFISLILVSIGTLAAVLIFERRAIASSSRPTRQEKKTRNKNRPA